jgi:hypothetical protein
MVIAARTSGACCPRAAKVAVTNLAATPTSQWDSIVFQRRFILLAFTSLAWLIALTLVLSSIFKDRTKHVPGKANNTATGTRRRSDFL